MLIEIETSINKSCGLLDDSYGRGVKLFILNCRMRISMEISGHFALTHNINMAVSVADKIFILR